MKTLKEVAIVSLFGAIASVILVFSIAVLGMQDYSSHSSRSTHAFIKWDTLALAMGTIAFSFGGNFVYPEVEHSMRNPRDFPKVLKKGMSFITGIILKSNSRNVYDFCSYWICNLW